MAVAAVVTLLVVLLIEGCMSEHSKTATTANDAVTVQPETAPTGAIAPAPVAKPVVAPTQPVATPAAAPASPVVPASQKAMPGGYRPQMLYVVKPGDTLSRIAKLNHTTVKALKAINSLDTDMIAVGARLKVPAA